MDEFLLNIDRSVLPGRGGRVLVSLSGGADSVALLVALRELGYDCRAAHCNFYLRGEESNRDEAFVRQLCSELGVEVTVLDFGDVPGYARSHGISIEMACRELRLEATQKLMRELHCECIAIAHHQEDNVETFLLNALRGSGIAGLAAMKSRNGVLVRPMLGTTRAMIESYLAARGIGFVVDSTNAVSDVKRNRLRNILIPELRRLFPDANLELTLRAMASGRDFYEGAIAEAKRSCITSVGDVAVVDMTKVRSYAGAEALMVAIAADYGFNADTALLMLNCRRKGATFASESHEAVTTASTIEIVPLGSDYDEEYHFTLADVEGLPLPLKVERLDAPARYERDAAVLWFDAAIGDRQLTLRRWRNGDAIAPFGMGGRRRKLSDLFSDLHLSRLQKRRVWLLECEGEILWVVGLRASCHYACTPGRPAFKLTATL